jgi:hypothetical protein
MNHLTEEQFEDILQGAQVPDHVEDCPQCRGVLAEKQALAERLRQTFTSIRAGSDLADRIRANLGTVSDNTPATKSHPRAILLVTRRRLWSGLAAAAAVLLVAIPLVLYIGTSSQAHAAQRELVGIHKQNLESMDELFVHDDPHELARHLEDQIGHAPAMICTGSKLKVCGCCTRQFQGRTVGSYVVEAEGGPVSIVVVPDSPKTLGMKAERQVSSSQRPIWRASCQGCNMATVRIGDRSYCALGQVNHNELTAVLDNLLE